MLDIRRAILGLICALAFVAGPASAASAQGAPSGDPTAAGPTDGPVDTTAPTTVDPLVDEAAGDTVPAEAPTVPPPPGAYNGQRAYQPTRVLWSSVKRAESKLADVRWMRQEMIRQAHEARRQRKSLELRRDALEAQSAQTVAELEAAEGTMKERAVAAFVSNDQATEALIGTLEAANHDSVLALQVRDRLLGVALDADDVAIAEYVDLRDRLGVDLVTTVDTLASVDGSIADLEAQADGAAQAVSQAEAELAAFKAGSAIYIDGLVFPVAEGYERPLVGTFGAPRMPSTPDAHWHEGIDIFAPVGTPLVAAERGVVTSVGTNRLGGLSVWLRGESGTDWYYAHLSAFAPGLVEGQVVETGQLLGYVGNSGNALTTPAHVHLEIHPDGGDAVDPYPLLNVIAERDARR